MKRSFFRNAGRGALLPVLLVLAATAAFGTIAVARSVSKHDRTEPEEIGRDPFATVDDAEDVLEQAREEVAGLDDTALDRDDLRPTGDGRGDA